MLRRGNFPLYLLRNNYAKSATKPAVVDEKFTIKGRPEDATKIQFDYIGPPDKESNLRPVVRHIAEKEKNSARMLREYRDEVESWNHNFWTRHNKRFYDERTAYVEEHRKSADQAMTADEMSVFYKEFLDKNWRLHFYYNLSWYIKNWTLLFMALRVETEGLFRRKQK